MIGFSEFLAAATGRRPYPWQARLAEALAGGTDLQYVTAPTGAGKTTAIYAAVWALSAQAERPAPERTAGVRLIWAIDRRLLVDDVYEEAQALAARLDAAARNPSDALHAVATRLLALAQNGRWSGDFAAGDALARGFRPLEVGRWRGGLPTRLELSSPFQPQVITSTVPQVGSRLLFRGYGVSRRSRALEAALVARDALVFLDEAHLAEPFRQTVDAVIRHQQIQPREGLTLPPPLKLVTLTATPPEHDPALAIGLNEADLSDPSLLQRLKAAKHLRLVEAPEKAVDELVRLAREAAEQTPDGQAPVVGVVVNRVRTALDVHRDLERAYKDAEVQPRLALLIGPQRPADRRAQLTPEIRAWIYGEADPDGPVIVVATQTIEVGVDADLSHLITQSASVAATVQRIGRLNRRGKRSEAEVVVVRDPRFPLYAEDEPAAWEWLETIVSEHTGDVSVASLARIARPAQTPPSAAPLLNDAIVQQLAQTTDELGPFAEPDVEGLIRGADEDPKLEVSLCWRADLHPAALSDDAILRREALGRLAPPRPDEVVTVPIATARRLAAGDRGGIKPVVDGADGFTSVADDSGRPATSDQRFLVFRGREIREGSSAGAGGATPGGDEILAPKDIRPGDLVVLPTSLGGASDRGLDASAAWASESLLEFDGGAPSPPWIRLTQAAWIEKFGNDAPSREAWWELVGRARAALSTAATAWREHRSTSAPLAVFDAEQLRVLLGDRADEFAATSSDEGEWVLRELEVPQAQEDLDSGEAGSVTPEWVLVRRGDASVDEGQLRVDAQPPTLDQHCEDVAARAASWAQAAGLPEPLVEAVRLAGLVHDAGKADPRIQAWFAGGARRIGQPLVAKSVFGTQDPARSWSARKLAGMPSRLRHELASVAFLVDAVARDAVPGTLAATELSVASHLVGTHHGFGRPGFPLPVGGSQIGEWRASVGGIEAHARGDGLDGWGEGAWFSQFWELFDRYGPWTVAYLESLLVLADRTISKEGR